MRPHLVHRIIVSDHYVVKHLVAAMQRGCSGAPPVPLDGVRRGRWNRAAAYQIADDKGTASALAVP